MMPISYYMMAAFGLLSYMILTWVVVDMLKLPSSWVYTIRILSAAVGLAITGLVLHWKARRGAAAPGAAGAAGAPLPAEAEDMEPLFRDAQLRLAASPLGRDARIGTLPVLLVIGDSGAAKTSSLVHCGAEPELIGGHVYQEGYIVSTRALNIWFARNAVLVEAGGRLLNEGNRWLALLNRLRPARARSLFGRGRQAPRAVLVCFDVETLLKPGAQENVTLAARRLNARLGEVSRALSIQLPVYVLFTRCDRVPFFSEFVANFNDEEARQVVGTTVSMALDARAGVYADQEMHRLTGAIDELFLGLADQRPVQLQREHNSAKLPGVYEFPREFRKLRALAVQFMVELCRPSQLQTSPYLRGFYFSGVRPVEVREVVKAPRLEPSPRRSADATGVFSLQPDAAEALDAPRQQVQVRRVPQWVFLTRLFNEVILRDQAAFAASGRRSGADMPRRWLFGAAAGLAALLAIGWTTSFFANRSLRADVQNAAVAIGSYTPQPQQVPPKDALERLDSLRAKVEQLSNWSRNGAPLYMRLGLYTGNEMLPTVRRLYFSRFKQMLFGTTQEGLLAHMRKLPAAPGADDDYSYSYNTLKGYLITTYEYKRSTRQYLSPLLVARWAEGRQLDADRRTLVERQFDFYSDELAYANPYSTTSDAEAIERAREYLSRFNALERIYQALLAEVNSKAPSVNYNKKFVGSQAVIQNNKDVAGAFTRQGWPVMLETIRNWKKHFGGEEWVLGPRRGDAPDPATIEAALGERYRADFIGNWREYLKVSRVLPYASAEDAAAKLGKMSNPVDSYLLKLFCLASENTAAADKDVAGVYQPVQFVTPPGCLEKFSHSNNQGYMNGLMNLQGAVEQVARARNPNDPAVNTTIQAASSAKLAAGQVASNFSIDKEGHVERMTQQLLLDPITQIEGLLGALGPRQVNGAARSFCTEFNGLVNKYPFNTGSRVDASIDEVNGIFRPGGGSLWTFYEQNLKEHLVKQGAQYVPKPGAAIRITPSFLQFFNRAANFSDVLYRNGAAQDPQLGFTMKAMRSEGFTSLRIRFDGQDLKSGEAGGPQASFSWGPRAHEARMYTSRGGPEDSFLTFDGLWAAFRLFGDADRFDASGGGWHLQWIPKQGQSQQTTTLPSGATLTVHYFLDLGSTPPIFRKGYLSGFQCVSQAAQ